MGIYYHIKCALTRSIEVAALEERPARGKIAKKTEPGLSGTKKKMRSPFCNALSVCVCGKNGF